MKNYLVAGMSMALCLGAITTFAERTAKAVFNSETKVLTFYCDEIDYSGDNITVHKINSNGDASWSSETTTTQAVFDASFCYFQTHTLQGWFSEMTKLQEIIGFENIDTALATSIYNLFRNNDSLKIIDMSAWVCTNVTVVNGAYKTGSLKTIYVAPDFAWSPNVSGNAFSYTWALVGGAGSKWSKGEESVAYAKIDGGKDDKGFFTSKVPEYPPFVRKVVQTYCSDSQLTVDVSGFRLYGGTITVTLKKDDSVCDTKVLDDFGKATFTGLEKATTYVIDVLAENDYGEFAANGNEFTTLDDPTRRWFYDLDAGVVSNANWRFVASVTKNTTDMTVGTVKAWPDDVTELDLSGQVVDKNGTVYTIVTLNPLFGESTKESSYRPVGKSPQCSRVGALTLPKKLQRLSDCSFTQCANLTLVGGFPDTLTVIGDGSFKGVPLSGDLVITQMTVIGSSAFKSTKLTSVKFGPGLTSFGGNYDRGVFESCKQLTNVVFDSESSWSSGLYMFSACPALKELDLKGVTKAWDNLAPDSAVTNIIFSEKLEKVLINTFKELDSLKTVHFRGKVPDTMETPLYSLLSNTKTITTYAPHKYLSTKNAADKCWLDYAADNRIDRHDTTWASEYVGDSTTAKRPLLTTYLGTLIFLR